MPDPDAREPAVPTGYAEALAELEEILEELEGDGIDVDVLAAKVERGAALLRLCRDRVASARSRIEAVVAELDSEPRD